MRRSFPLFAILAVPLLLTILTLIGLFGALIYDGAWDVIGSALLGGVIGVALWAWVRARVGHRS